MAEQHITSLKSKLDEHKYKNLKDLVKFTLNSIPHDVTTSDGARIQVEKYELTNSRLVEKSDEIYQSRAIGYANVLLSLRYISELLVRELGYSQKQLQEVSLTYDLFTEIVEDLMLENFIRVKPDILRSQFKIIEGGRNDREETKKTLRP